MLGKASPGTTFAAGRERGSDPDLGGLLDARQRMLDAGNTVAAGGLAEVICARLRTQGDIVRATALGQATLDTMPSPSAGAARWLRELGAIAQAAGDYARAEDQFLRAVQMFAELGDAVGVARSYDSLGVMAHARGDYQQAERYYQAATCFQVPQAVWPHELPAPAAEPARPSRAAQPRRPDPEARPDPGPDGLEPDRWDAAALALTDIAAGAGQPLSEAACAELARAGAARASSQARLLTGPDGRRHAGRPRPPGRGARPAGPADGRRHAGRPRPRGRGARPAGLRLRPVVIAAGTVAVAAAVAIVRVTGPGGTASANAGLAGAPGGASAAAAAAGGDRIQAAAWAAAQISGSAVVGCDPAMCTALRTQGVAAGNLVVIGAGAQSDPLGCNIVVATAAVRGALGARLTRVYAPLVLARFGSGSARIEMRVVAPDGTGAYLQALSADQAARTQAGAQLLANRQLSEAPAARRELAGGRVDTRLLTTIAALANGRRLRILQFGTAGPGADPRVPRPSAEIAAAGPGPARAELSAVAAFLRAQRSPYLATGISVTRLASGQLVLRVAFGEPGPLGLLSPASAWPARVVSPAGRRGATISAAGSARPGAGGAPPETGGTGAAAPGPAPEPGPVSTAIPAG